MSDYKLKSNAIYQVQSEIDKSADNVDSVERLAGRRETYLETLRVEFLRKLFPNGIAAEKIKGEIELIKSEYEFRKRALELIRKHQLQALQEVYNQYLVQGKADIRRNTMEFMLQKRLELETVLDAKYNEFIESRIFQYEKADKIPVQSLKKMEIERLDDATIGFKNLADKLVREFERIVEEAIKV